MRDAGLLRFTGVARGLKHHSTCTEDSCTSVHSVGWETQHLGSLRWHGGLCRNGALYQKDDLSRWLAGRRWVTQPVWHACRGRRTYSARLAGTQRKAHVKWLAVRVRKTQRGWLACSTRVGESGWPGQNERRSPKDAAPRRVFENTRMRRNNKGPKAPRSSRATSTLGDAVSPAMPGETSRTAGRLILRFMDV